MKRTSFSLFAPAMAVLCCLACATPPPPVVEPTPIDNSANGDGTTASQSTFAAEQAHPEYAYSGSGAGNANSYGRARPAGSSAYSGPGSCRLAISGDSPVDRACAEGGVRAAKIVMKDLVRRGRAAGVSHDCSDCHSNDDDYSQLAQGSHERFARLLDATRR